MDNQSVFEVASWFEDFARCIADVLSVVPNPNGKGIGI